MKKALMVVSILLVAVISTACINDIAVQELNNKAAMYMEAGNYDAAVSRLQTSIDLDCTLYQTYYNLGIAAYKAKKYDISMEAFKNGKKLKPNFPDFYYSLAITQSEYADKLLEEDKANPDLDKRLEAAKYKKQAALNFKKYLKLVPAAKDKNTIRALVEDCLNSANDSSTSMLQGQD